MSLPLASLTGQILEAAIGVSTELGPGFLESVHEGALPFVLQDEGLQAERQVILELKAAKVLVPEHVAQTLNYLQATGLPVAMLLNFGTARFEYRRFDDRFSKRMINRDEGDAGDD